MTVADDDPLYELGGEVDDDGWVECYECGGEGFFHDCGEDCCPCLDKEGPPLSPCGSCDGEGGWIETFGEDE